MTLASTFPRMALGAALSLGLIGALLPVPAGAQTIFRCGNAYSPVPCRNGIPLETADTRSAAQRAEARAIVGQEQRLAAQMETDRRRAESATRPALAGTFGPRPASAPPAPVVKKPKRAKRHAATVGAVEPFVARVPGEDTRRRSRRTP